MTFYLDTSPLVAVLTQEPSSDRIGAWMRSHADDGFAISHCVTTEFASALSLKIRTGQMPADEQPLVLAAWHRLSAGFSTYPIEQTHFLAAAQMCERHDLGLRAGDALHIAVARAAGCALVTLDRAMAEAATALGVSVAEV